MRSRRRSPSRERAFTLVELLVVTAITGIVVAALGVFFATQYRAYLRQRVEIDLEEDLRSATRFLVRELRVAGLTLDPGGEDGLAGELEVDLSSARLSWRISYSGKELPPGFAGSAPEEGGRELSFSDGALLFTREGTPGEETLVDGLEEVRFRSFDPVEQGDCRAIHTAEGQSVVTCTFDEESGPYYAERIRRIEIRLTAARAAPGGAVRKSLVAAATLRNRP